MSDKLYDKIIDKLDSFSSGQQKVAKYIVDNYPEIVIEKGNIDELIMVLVKGEKI